MAKAQQKPQPKKQVKKNTPKPTKSKAEVKNNKKQVQKQQKKKVKQDKPQQKRVLRVREASIDVAGIGIGPARVKRVLTTVALNPNEAYARSILLAAENKPVMPKSTKTNPNPQMPAQGTQTPLSKLPSDVLALVNEAEDSYRNTLVDGYERHRLKQLLANNKKKITLASYQLAKKEAQAKPDFSLHDFNKSMFSDFYNDLEAWVKNTDNYVVGKTVEEVDVKTGNKKTVELYNQWTRAVALINKLCVRLSSETRNILAGFLDNIVLQYAENGMFNCVNDKLSIVKLKHVLHKGTGFEDRVPLDAFARTLDSYGNALLWLAETGEKKYESTYSEEFDGYIVNICHSVRMRLANSTEDAELKMKYLNTSLSTEFKKFCSNLVYESILRVGSILRNVIDLNGVKTVSDNLMFHAIRQLHATVGLDASTLEVDLRARLDKFSKWRGVRKEKRRNNDNDSNVETDDE